MVSDWNTVRSSFQQIWIVSKKSLVEQKQLDAFLVWNLPEILSRIVWLNQCFISTRHANGQAVFIMFLQEKHLSSHAMV